MPRKIIFAAREAFRIIKHNLGDSLLFFLFSSLNLLGMALAFIIIININYLLEVFTTRNLSYPLIFSLVSVIDNINRVRNLQLLLLIFFTLGSIYLHKIYLGKYIYYYRAEIELIIKLNCDRRLIKTPLLFIAFFINGLSILIVRGLLGIGYGFIYNLVVRNYIRFSLLCFQHFDTSLLLFLLIITTGVIFSTNYFLIHRKLC